MHGLKIVVLTPDAERFRGALTLAAAHAALGGNAAVMLQLDSVFLLHAPINAPRDEAHRANGLPTLSVLMDDALSLGVRLVACQSGLALSGLSMENLDPRIVAGGTVSFLQHMEQTDRLLVA